MKRDIVFHNSGDLTTALGVDETRSRAIELRINELIERNASKREILTEFNEEWVMPAEEWRTDSWDGPRCWYPPRHGTNDDELTDADVHCRLCGASPEAKDASDE